MEKLVLGETEQLQIQFSDGTTKFLQLDSLFFSLQKENLVGGSVGADSLEKLTNVIDRAVGSKVGVVNAIAIYRRVSEYIVDASKKLSASESLPITTDSESKTS